MRAKGINSHKELIQPDTLLSCKDGTIGVGQIYNAGHNTIRLRLITPEGKRDVSRDEVKTHKGLISLELANWLKQNYRVSLLEIQSGLYKVQNPFG
jgi:hypothetical protein